MKYILNLLLIIAICGIACSDFIEEPINEDRIELLSPGQHAESATYDIHFMWNSLPDADTYHLQIASPNFEHANLFYADTLMEGTKFKISLEPGKYCWRVKGVNGSSETAFSSRCFTIYESDFTKQLVLLDSPVPQYLSSDDKIDFQWQSVFRAAHYVLEVDTNNFQDVDELAFRSTVDGKSYQLSPLKENSYQWRVKAVNGEEESNWSEIRHFTLDHTPPTAPTLRSPTNNQLTQLPVDLIWEPVNDAESYELFIYQSDSTTLYSERYPLKTQSTHHQFTGGQSSGRVLWRIRTYDRAGNVSSFSSFRSMIIAN